MRGMDVGSMVHVSLRLDNAGSFDWPWCADWVRTVIVYYFCGNSGESFLFFLLENRIGIESYHLDNTNDFFALSRWEKDQKDQVVCLYLKWATTANRS